jgi:hypothetical protein
MYVHLAASRAANGTNVAFVNLQRLFGTIAAIPAPFGYTGNHTCLVSANAILGGCGDPDRSIFHIRGFFPLSCFFFL